MLSQLRRLCHFGRWRKSGGIWALQQMAIYYILILLCCSLWCCCAGLVEKYYRFKTRCQTYILCMVTGCGTVIHLLKKINLEKEGPIGSDWSKMLADHLQQMKRRKVISSSIQIREFFVHFSWVDDDYNPGKEFIQFQYMEVVVNDSGRRGNQQEQKFLQFVKRRISFCSGGHYYGGFTYY